MNVKTKEFSMTGWVRVTISNLLWSAGMMLVKISRIIGS